MATSAEPLTPNNLTNVCTLLDIAAPALLRKPEEIGLREQKVLLHIVAVFGCYRSNRCAYVEHLGWSDIIGADYLENKIGELRRKHFHRWRGGRGLDGRGLYRFVKRCVYSLVRPKGTYRATSEERGVLSDFFSELGILLDDPMFEKSGMAIPQAVIG